MTWLEFAAAIEEIAADTGRPVKEVRDAALTTLAIFAPCDERQKTLDAVRSVMS